MIFFLYEDLKKLHPQENLKKYEDRKKIVCFNYNITYMNISII